LQKCFSAVFPDLDEQEIEEATPGAISGWDSVAHATLLAVVEEEFDVMIDPDAIEQIDSFRSLLSYLVSTREPTT
jgi:acyl carrier protein